MTAYARVENGVVIEILDIGLDPNEIYPPEIPWTPIPEGIPVDQGWLYDGENFSEPPPKVPDLEELARGAQVLVDSQMAYATMQIGRLQDAVDLGVATEAEIALLAAWRLFRIEIGRVPEQENYPLEIQWPQQPV